MVVVGRLIEQRRKAKHLSQVQLADLLGTTQRQISRWEGYGATLPREGSREALGAVLAIAPSEWFAAAAATIAADDAGATPAESDSALLLRFGAEVVPDEEAVAALEDFQASARTGRGNLIPQNYDDMRPRPKGKRAPKPEPSTFKLRISGHCLHGTVEDGEVVWFDTLLSREPPALVFAVKDDHEAHIKRLVRRDGALWLESNDGWSALVDEHWRIGARAFNAQRRLL
jgi:transcriptional regulator with XRE-family HTH domain